MKRKRKKWMKRKRSQSPKSAPCPFSPVRPGWKQPISPRPDVYRNQRERRTGSAGDNHRLTAYERKKKKGLRSPDGRGVRTIITAELNNPPTCPKPSHWTNITSNTANIEPKKTSVTGKPLKERRPRTNNYPNGRNKHANTRI